MYQGPKSN
jgi:hypothetical protein